VARIEGTGIKEPSKEAKVANLKFLRNPKKFLQDKIDKKLDSYTREGKTPFGTGIGGSAVGEEGLGRFGRDDLSDASVRFGNQFSPSVEVASANLSSLDVGDSFTKQVKSNLADSSTGEAQPLSLPGSAEYKQELKQYEESIRKDYRGIERYGTDELDNLTEEGRKRLEDSYNIYRDYNYERNPLKYQQGIDFSKKEEKKGLPERISDFAGNIFNTVTGTQPAAASQIPGGMPTGTQFSPSGDTSFASYRMAGGGQQQGSGIVTPFSQTSMGKKEPRSITKFQDTSMGRKTVTIDGQEVARKQTVASLPSNYKQTEAEAFRKTAAFKEAQGIAKRNPNVSVGVDSKGQPRATATNDSGVARAQAAAVNRKISGKTISQTKAANKAAMRRAAAERNASFQARKKAGKLSSSERTAKGQRAANKAKARARAQAAAKARKAKKNQSRRRSTRGRRGRRGGRR
tara:strand:- start:41 stop:1417 length:1377 start_codon:yes stop_codon:yes gene_type:complete